MTWTISKEFAFSASHQLTSLPDGHPCARLHGHNYTVTVELAASDLDQHGMVVDFGHLAEFGAFVADRFDHRHLNDVMIDAPTSEHLARLLYVEAHALCPQTTAVTVRETPKTSATYRTPA